MITPRFGFTKDFAKEWNSRVYCRLSKILCGFKDQVRAHRIGRYLERQGWLERDAENDYLALDGADDDPLSVLQSHSITYRIALGPQAGRKVFSLQTLPPIDIDETHSAAVGQVAGFNLHAGVAARADQRRKLERLCRYIARPAVSEQSLSLTAQG